MDKKFKKLVTYKIDEYTPLCNVPIARQHLVECKSRIVDDAVAAFETMTFHTMIAVDYISVESGYEFNTVGCAGYVWTSPRRAERWWFCYRVNAYTGDQSLLVVDGDDNESEYQL